MAGLGRNAAGIDPRQCSFATGSQRVPRRPAPRVCPSRHLHVVASGPSAAAPSIERPILLNGQATQQTVQRDGRPGGGGSDGGDPGGNAGGSDPRPSLLAAGRLSPDSTIFMEEHRIRAYEVGPDQRTTIVTIANLLQEVAGNHGVALWGRTEEGFATDPIMVANNLIFVATRIQIRMDSYPKWGDVVRIETWFHPDGRIGAARNWVMRNAETGEVFGRSTSTWVMLNTEKRRAVRIPDEMRVKLYAYTPQPLRETFEPAEMKQRLPELALPAEIEGPKQVARRSDIDMNGHINNVTYLGWALETVPMDTFLTCKLHQVEIDFKAECNAGDTVESLGSRTEPPVGGTNVAAARRHFLHTLQRCDDDGVCRELVRCRTQWAPSDE